MVMQDAGCHDQETGCQGTEALNGTKRRWVPILLMLSLVVALSACDSFFDVDLPGRLVAADLNDPELAETLALGVQGDLECAFRGYLYNDLIWSGAATFLGAEREWFLTEQRSIDTRLVANADCSWPSPGGH
jgi:hypothetical protein